MTSISFEDLRWGTRSNLSNVHRDCENGQKADNHLGFVFANEMYNTACNSFDTLMTCLVLYSETGTCSLKIAESLRELWLKCYNNKTAFLRKHRLFLLCKEI